MGLQRQSTGLVLAASLLLATPVAAAASPASTQRVSVSSLGAQGSALSGNAVRNQRISGDGRVVAFYSEADDLVPGDDNGQPDVLVRDLTTGRTSVASVSTDGQPSDGLSEWPSLDSTGRYVAFLSYADNLVPGDTNGTPDVFVRDRVAGTTARVSVTDDGGQTSGYAGQPAISADGREVAFESDAAELLPAGAVATGFPQVYVRDLDTGTTRLVSATPDGTPGGGPSTRASISADGSRVAFQSAAADLVPGDTNGRCDQFGCSTDAFVRDTVAGRTVRVSVRPDGSQGVGGSAPSISGNGQRVAMLGQGLGGPVQSSGDHDDVYVRDLVRRTTVLASTTSTGARVRGTVGPPELSGNGWSVAFSTRAQLVPSDTDSWQDVYVRDLGRGRLRRASVGSGGAQGDGFSIDPDISADGLRVVFVSSATDLVARDTNGVLDVFLRCA